MSTSGQEIVKPLEWRCATKKFDATAKVDDATFAVLEEVLRLAPSSFGLQPWKFVVVTEQVKKQELLSACFNQQQIVDCSHLVVICRVAPLAKGHIEHYLETIMQVRGATRDSLTDYANRIYSYMDSLPTEKINQWATCQCFIALGFLLSAAATLGVDACPMEGFDKEKVDTILDLPAKNCASVVLCPVGVRSEADKYAKAAKVRFPASELFIRL